MEIVHVRPVENDLSPGGGLEEVLATLRHEAPPAEDDGGEAVNLEELADHIDQNDPLPATTPARPDLRHPDDVGETGLADDLRDGVPPLDVARNQDQLEVRPAFEQPPVNIQNDCFFSFVRAPRDENPIPRRHIQASGDLPFQLRGNAGREAVVLRVSENMDP